MILAATFHSELTEDRHVHQLHRHHGVAAAFALQSSPPERRFCPFESEHQVSAMRHGIFAFLIRPGPSRTRLEDGLVRLLLICVLQYLSLLLVHLSVVLLLKSR